MGRLRPSKRTFTARGSTSPAGDTHIRPLPNSCPPANGSACMSPHHDSQHAGHTPQRCDAKLSDSSLHAHIYMILLLHPRALHSTGQTLSRGAQR